MAHSSRKVSLQPYTVTDANALRLLVSGSESDSECTQRSPSRTIPTKSNALRASQHSQNFNLHFTRHSCTCIVLLHCTAYYTYYVRGSLLATSVSRSRLDGTEPVESYGFSCQSSNVYNHVMVTTVICHMPWHPCGSQPQPVSAKSPIPSDCRRRDPYTVVERIRDSLLCDNSFLLTELNK